MLEQELITSTRFLGALSMLVMAVIVAVVNRGKVKSQVYDRSRWLIVTACLILGIHNMLQFFTHLREQNASLAWCVNMVFYVPVFLGFNLGARNMLYAGLNMKRPMILAAAFNAICYVLLLIGLFTDTLVHDEKPYMTMTCVVAVLLFAETVFMTLRMRRDMRLLEQRLTDVELEECHRFLRYTAQSICWMLYIAIFVPLIGMSDSLMLHSLIGLLLFGITLWFIIGFCLYGHDMHSVINVNNELYEAIVTEDEMAGPADTSTDDVKQRIDKWVEERHFADPNMTIALAIKQMNISASSLNYYLEQNTSTRHFSKWLSIVRVEEAKHLMLKYPNYKNDTIANMVGLSNGSSLSRTFKMQEGMTPSKWLEQSKSSPSRVSAMY